jgi:inhibitor of cysteine peptidase
MLVIKMVKLEFRQCKMKRTMYLFVLTLVIPLLTIVSCQSGTSEGETEIRPAPIHEVDVRIAESFPPQVFVHIKGGLADSCTTFHELTTERSGNTIEIEVTTQRPRDKECAQVYSYFEKNVALGSNFTSDETYFINVNDEKTTFVMQ